jgi:hypothetical protein
LIIDALATTVEDCRQILAKFRTGELRGFRAGHPREQLWPILRKEGKYAFPTQRSCSWVDFQIVNRRPDGKDRKAVKTDSKIRQMRLRNWDIEGQKTSNW